MAIIDACLGSADYHQQDDLDFCGQAVAQMILGGLNAPIGNQAELRRKAGITGLGTTPEQLCFTLNDTCVPPTGKFVVPAEHDKVDSARRLFTALTASSIAVPALVLGGSHWVAVTGAVCDGDPAGASADVLGFFINNPEPQNPKKGCAPANRRIADPHGKDDTCGAFAPECADYGSANAFVTMYEWLNFYWEARRGEPRAFTTICTEGAAALPIRGRISHNEARRTAPGVTLSKREACAAALCGIERFGLDRGRSPLAELVAGVTAQPDEVFTVDELGSNPPRIGSSEPYYLVSLRRDQVHVASARVGIAEGRFLSLQAPPSLVPGRHELFDFAEAALRRYESETGDLDARVIAERGFTVHPTLVWRRSAQSMCPFYPFVQINVAGTLVYASMDRRIHRRIDDHAIAGAPKTSGEIVRVT
jgi:hypothetical protein